VFHDDQHGTAIVVLAALTNALRCVAKALPEVAIVVAGAGAAGTAICDLLLAAGVRRLLGWDKEGILAPDDGTPGEAKLRLATRTNPDCRRGGLRDALSGADVIIGVSAANILPAADLAVMAERPIVFALANPDPEVPVDEARQYATVIATGRSDYPN